jgi:hypothetical protein
VFRRLIGVRVTRPATTDLEEQHTMQLESRLRAWEFVVSRAPQPKNDNDGRQKVDRDTGASLHVTELVAMDDTGAEVIKVTTAGEPRVTTRQLVTVVKLVATPWNIDGRGGVAFRAGRSSPSPPVRRLHLLWVRGPALPGAVSDERLDDHRP